MNLTQEQVMIALLCATFVIREISYQRSSASQDERIRRILEYMDEAAALTIILNAKVNALETPQDQLHIISEY